MAISVLIIDDSEEYRALLKIWLKREVEDVQVHEYDALRLPKPDHSFNWSEYDVVILDYQLGKEDGLTWLEEFQTLSGYPPTIVLTAEGDEYVALRAMKIGASDYINKRDVTGGRLNEMIADALQFTPRKQAHHDKTVRDANDMLDELRESKMTSDMSSSYKFVSRIGGGLTSDVFLAERLEDQQSVVLKILNISNVQSETYIKRFIQEAKLLSQLNNPFVANIFEYGVTNNDYVYIVIEFFPRGDLKHRLELNFDAEIATLYINHIVHGLAAIHKVGIIHRDIKPANIMFRGDDSLALADFGISKNLYDDGDLTAVGQILGTPHYMSPEQGLGRPTDERSDIYSAGVIYYELLTKHKPYMGKSPSALIFQHVNNEIPRLPSHMMHYQSIIDKAMAKNPEDRYQTAQEFIDVLNAAEQGNFDIA